MSVPKPELFSTGYEALKEYGGASKYVQKIAEIKHSNEGVQHEYTFYLNSSDSMETLATQKCGVKAL